jgi:hypothetical protein
MVGGNFCNAGGKYSPYLARIKYPYRAQTITFPAIPAKTYGDAAIAKPTASSGLPISITSTNPAVAGTVGDSIAFLGAGTASLTASQPGDTTWLPALSVIQPVTVGKKSISITGVSAMNKVYDGTTTANLAGGTVIGKVAGDSLTIHFGPAFFASRNVGLTQGVSVTGTTLGGPKAANYDLVGGDPTSLSANITAKKLTLVGLTVNTKVYDGTTAATLAGTADLAGKVVGDDVQVQKGVVSALFDNKDVGTSKDVSISGYSIDGADQGNYLFTSNLVGNITLKTLTLTAIDTMRTTDGANPVFRWTIAGLALSETSSLVTGVMASSTAENASEPGEYPISLSGGIAPNYIITYIPGKLTLTSVPVISLGHKSTFNKPSRVEVFDVSGRHLLTRDAIAKPVQRNYIKH